MRYNNPEATIIMTPEWKGERFPDGRPKVPDSVLDRLREIKLAEAWAPLFKKGYRFQHECDLKMTHPGAQLVGRAVTAIMVPSRPDVHMTLLDYGHKAENYTGFFNQWVVDCLQENDVLVVDMFDKVIAGTFIGGNLATSIKSRTKRGGAVMWGGLRDLEQVSAIEDFQVYYRGNDPAAISDAMMTGINVPCRIGRAICMPGDVVLGTGSGVIFIPAHLAELVAAAGEKTKLKDVFGFERLKEGVYTSAHIDVAVWQKYVMDDFQQWLKASPFAEEFKHLDWSEEIEASNNAVPGTIFTGLAL